MATKDFIEHVSIFRRETGALVKKYRIIKETWALSRGVDTHVFCMISASVYCLQGIPLHKPTKHKSTH